jgi:hypothetical protein
VGVLAGILLIIAYGSGLFFTASRVANDLSIPLPRRAWWAAAAALFWPVAVLYWVRRGHREIGPELGLRSPARRSPRGYR